MVVAIVGVQEKIHPFDYERDRVTPGTEAKIFRVNGISFGVVICYDMVFPTVTRTLARKGAEIILAPSRIVKEGLTPWHMYVQVRALENRIPIVAANVHNQKFGGRSMIVDLQLGRIVTTDVRILDGGQCLATVDLDLVRYKTSRESRLGDANPFE